MKLLLKTRPYERRRAPRTPSTRRASRRSARPSRATASRTRSILEGLVPVMIRARDRFRAIPADYDASRPLIGVVGEIFCRQNTLLQLRPHPCGRGAGRGVLALGHRRVGLVHGRRAAPAAHRRRAPSTRTTPSAASRTDHAQGRARPVRSVSRRLRRLRRAGGRPPGPRPELPVPAVHRGPRRDGPQQRQVDLPARARAPTASSTSARSPA